jgi:hypothetical protein
MKTIFLVWVGGIADEFDNEEDAKLRAAEWIAQGYDDVQIQAVQETTMKESK